MSEYDSKILKKVLNPAEQLTWLFDGKLPANITNRYARYCREHPETKTRNKEAKRLQRELKGKLAGLTKDQYHIPPGEKWVPTAVVLPVMETTCTTCHSKIRAVMGKPLVESIHPIKGVKQELHHQYDDVSLLPKQTHIYYQTVEFCEACFPAAEIIRHPQPGVISYDD